MPKFYSTVQDHTLWSLFGTADFPQAIAALVLE